MPKPSRSALVKTLLDTVLQAGALLRRALERPRRIRYKGEKNIVTEMDQAVEDLFVRTIRRRFPGHEILSEEMAEQAGSRPDRPGGRGVTRWIIDPIDGTTNYAHGFPQFAVSAGIECDGRIVLGAVYDPMLEDLFFARKGEGAWRNKKPIRVSRVGRLGQALLATGFPYNVTTTQDKNISEFYWLSLESHAVRRLGSAALDLCHVACGRFDGFWEFNLKPWDVAAGALILQEAGGRLTDFFGRPAAVYGQQFLASNRRLHPALIKALAEAQTIKPELQACLGRIGRR